MSSKFDPQLGEITDRRERGEAWGTIADALTAAGIKCNRSELFSWYKRQTAKARRILAEVEPVKQLIQQRTAQTAQTAQTAPAPVNQASPNARVSPPALAQTDDSELNAPIRSNTPELILKPSLKNRTKQP
ncbi:hypothetical protein QT970_03475 [Microcoleus sp. herbarium8]|uniref:hypothetical protein n=1 Tax=Microcoleus sp. herbarium8 TaxID=3055436 RepID=UPI002FD36A63